MTYSQGGGLVKMMVDDRDGYRNNAGLVVCLYQCIISKACNLKKCVPLP